MIMQYMMRDARPLGGIIGIKDVTKGIDDFPLLYKQPMLICSEGGLQRPDFEKVAGKMPFGSVICFSRLLPEELDSVARTAEKYEWREWNPPGREPHETMFVRSHWQDTYATHQKYLLEAVKQTTGKVLELGAGEGSTRVLHELCKALTGKQLLQDGGARLLVTIDNSADWIGKFLSLKDDGHRFEHNPDPASSMWLVNHQWGVVFVDHAPGETRAKAVERVRNKADYIVVHDTEDCGYQIYDLLESFKYKRHFRYMRPWTSVVSETREIFESPFAEER